MLFGFYDSLEVRTGRSRVANTVAPSIMTTTFKISLSGRRTLTPQMRDLADSVGLTY
jgi:hypothetical protein